MNIVDSVIITGLWEESQTISFNLDKKFNFIIGKNGTGKTTVINLIAAALTCESERLFKTNFKQISIKFTTGTPGGKKPSVTVYRKRTSDTACEIFYEFKTAQTDENPISYTLQTEERQVGWDFFRASSFGKGPDRNFQIRSALNEIITVSWLSVNRASTPNYPDPERPNITTAIDQKLTELKNNLVKYFASLGKKYELKVVEFQKKTLLSVLTPEGSLETLKQSGTINIDEERIALQNIFSMLGVERKIVTNKIESHLENFKKAMESSTTRTPSIESFISVYHALRAHQLVQDYEDLKGEKEKIFKPQSDFLKEINDLFEGRKKIEINEKNEIFVTARTGKPIPLESLSSGEKQLIIILGEALLQNSKKAIFIADEPELSLHILWQEAITSAISRINTNAQIIFATHSPDIVGGRSDNIINMEKLNP